MFYHGMVNLVDKRSFQSCSVLKYPYVPLKPNTSHTKIGKEDQKKLIRVLPFTKLV